MMQFDCEQIGLNKAELQERIIESIADKLLHQRPDGDITAKRLESRLVDVIQERTDKAVNDIAEEHILPNAKRYVEDICLQETNKWGEKKGKPLSFKEYLVSRAEHYMQETVDYEGKGKDAGGYNWSGKQTRLTYLIHQHLQYSIEYAVKEILKNANNQLASSIRTSVKLKLDEIAKQIKVQV